MDTNNGQLKGSDVGPKRRALEWIERNGRRLLTHRWLALGLALLAALLTLPSLGVGLLFDDYQHKLLMQQSDSPLRLLNAPWDMFRLLDGDPRRNAELMDYGVLPWWADVNIKGAFWRPIASLTHWLDYTLWPGTPALMHAQSIAWYALLVGCAAFFYRRVMGAGVAAGLAAGLILAAVAIAGLPALCSRIAGFWLAGMILSLVPAATTFASDRMLLFAGIGAMGLIAQLLVVVFSGALPGGRLRRTGALGLAWALAILHIVIAPLALAIRTAPIGPKLVEPLYMHDPLDRAVESQDLVVVNPPSVLALTVGTPFLWASEHAPMPRHFRVLSSSCFYPVEVRRTDETTLLVRPRD